MLCPSHTDAYPIYVYLPLLIVFRLTEIYTEAGSSDGGTVSVLHAPRRARLGRYDDCLHCAWVSIPFSFSLHSLFFFSFFPLPPSEPWTKPMLLPTVKSHSQRKQLSGDPRIPWTSQS